MPQHSHIKKALAGLLLCVFALSITPKTLLHTLIADHKDSSSFNASKGQHVEAAGFHCDIDHLVVEVPFVIESNDVELNVVKVFNPITPGQYVFYHATAQFFYSLRGPPSLTV